MNNKNFKQIPITWLRFLRWFCPPELLESIEGDLLEQFEMNSAISGIKTARRKFIVQVLRFFRPGIVLRNKFSFNLINTMLFQSFFKISYRNMWRNKGYSAINIIGLAIGIAACLLTFSFVSFELSYDNFHPDVNRLYRVNQTMIWRPEGGIFNSTGPALAQALKDNYPEIQEVLRINTAGSYVVRYDDDKGNITAINEDNVLAADSNFFDFFAFHLKEGNPELALKGVDKVVISDVAEKKLFGDQPGLGKILLLGEDRKPVVVSGVTEHQPENMHFHFDYLLSMYTNPNIKKFEWSWIWTQVVTYVKLKPGVNKAALEVKLKTLGETRVKPSCESYGIDYDQIVKGKGGWNFYLQPVRDIHLHSAEIGNRLGPVGDITYSVVFAVIGIFVLLIAAINFINLSTARGTTRAREVGVKKTLGAFRSSLIWQFQIESVLIATVATIIAIFITEGLKSIIHQITDINIPLQFLTKPEQLIAIPLIPLVIGCLAGMYPSFYLTAFRPVQVLKGRISAGMGNSGLRNILVTVQFVISVALIGGTMVVFQQIKFLTTKNLGFDKENIMIVGHAEKLGEHIKSFRNEIIKLPGVTDAAIAMDVPGGGYYEDIWTMEGSDTKLPVTELKTDDHFFDIMGFKLVAGRSFEKDNPADKMAAVPNETTVRLFGLTPEDALGKHIIYPGDDNATLEIIGVVKDFNYHSLHEPITPLVIINTDAKVWGDMRVIAVKFKTNSLPGLMKRIKDQWKASLDATPIELSFLDQQLAQQYDEERKLGKLLAMLSGLSIVVAIIGLIGLVSYSVETRKKEIGIRKVFGASVAQIIMMLNNQYAKLLGIALVVASPLAWWAIQQWLDSFAYKIHIDEFVFILAGIVELSVTSICVGFVALRTAILNPAHVLRDE